MLRVGLLLLAVASLHAADLDRDGLDDAPEQRLLRQFVPVFLVSGGECDAAPAEFVAAEASNFRSMAEWPTTAYSVGGVKMRVRMPLTFS